MVYALRAIAALAATSGALAQGADSQRPLAGDHESPRPHSRPEYPSKDARLYVYNGSSYSWDALRSDIDVPVDVCASANFTLDANVHVSYAGACGGPDGKFPYMAIYPSADCTGVHSHPRWYDRGSGFGPGHTLGKAVWGASEELIEPPEGQWSIAFRCDDPESPEPLEQMKLVQPVPPPPPPPAPPKPRPTTASISDSACYIPGLPGLQGAPRFIFKRTEADNCLDIKAKHRLKIYRNALCADGSEAQLARFTGTGCRGRPRDVLDVDEGMMATNFDDTCIDMGGEKDASYAFWCTGNLHRKKVKGDLFPDEDGGVRIHYTNGQGSFTYKAPGEDESGADGVRSVFGVVMAVVAGVMAFVM